MKKIISTFVILTFPFLVNAGISKRPYHVDNYEIGCTVCHDLGIKAPPSGDGCLDCHDIDALVKTTKRHGDEKWQNPHNNLHYGKEVPCTECHGEHKSKDVLCNDCHTFKFPKHNK